MMVLGGLGSGGDGGHASGCAVMVCLASRGIQFGLTCQYSWIEMFA
jgi:hypothetical protein